MSDFAGSAEYAGFADSARAWLVRNHGDDPVTVLRSGRSWLLAAGGWVVRVRPDVAGDVDEVEREVVVARVLEGAGVPAVRLAGPTDQPVHLSGVGEDGAVMSVWAEVAHRPGVVTAATLGALARQLHDATRPPLPEVGDLDPFAASAAQVDGARRLGHTALAEMDLLDAAARELRAAWTRLAADDPLGTALVHGDLHVGNVLVGPDGPVLADLELAGMGPASYDLAPTLVAIDRYGADPAGADAWVAAYGADPRRWEGMAALCRAYELWVTAWSLSHRQLSAAHEREARARLAAWDGTGQHTPWSLL